MESYTNIGEGVIVSSKSIIKLIIYFTRIYEPLRGKHNTMFHKDNFVSACK